MDEQKEPQLPPSILAAQSEMKVIKKDSTNPHFNKPYLSLTGILEAVLPVYNKHGISILQDIQLEDGLIACFTFLSHSSGETMRFGPLKLPAPRQDPQAFGSAITYARRYHLQSVLGLAAEDDDGEKASKPAGVEVPKLATKFTSSEGAKTMTTGVQADANSDNLASVITAADWRGRSGKGPYRVSTPEGEFQGFEESTMRSIKPGVLVVYKKTRFGLDVVKVEGPSAEPKEESDVPF